MADTLVERVTGQAGATDVNVELQIAMPLDALLDANSQAAELDGYRPLPSDLACDLLSTPVLVAPAIRRASRWPAGWWGSTPPTLRRLRQEVDHVA
jgi:hypothetical protein